MKKQKHNTNPKAALCVFAGITCGAALVLSPLQIHAAESTALPVTSTAEQQNDVIASGEKNYISWTLTADGTLTVTGYGQGTMNDYDQNETYAPWNDYGPQVKKIIIGQGVTSVGKHAFYNCKNATEIEIGNSVKKIASCAFGSTFTSVTIPASVTSIDKYAFTSAAASQGYYVDPQNQYYSNDEKGVLFDKNKTQLQHAPLNLNGKYVVPDTVTTLVDYCFDGCDKLTELEVGNSVTAIQTSAFGTCTHMKTLTIGNGVQDVGNLFSRCNLPELETLNLGSGFTKIEYLHNLPSVMNINVSASNFFELVQDGTTLKQGITSADIAGTDASREFYMNFLSMSGGSQWNATEQLGTIQLRVIGENGAAKIVSNDFLVSQKDGYGGYPCEANEVTVVVSTECTVKFESRGGDEIPSQQVQYGEKVAEPQSPSREGYLFQGWYSDIDLKEQWDFKDDVVKKNMTLYGSWKQGNLDEAETDEQPQKKSGAWIIIPLLVVAIFLLFLLLIRRKSRKNDNIR